MMVDYIDKNGTKTIKLSDDLGPDPWLEEPATPATITHPSWQFPLDPKHEIQAAPAADGILSPASDPNLLQLSAPKTDPVPMTIQMLLEEELKLNVNQGKNIWQQVRDALALLWWSLPEEQLMA